jgi:predicted component of type VI protein secretion system
MPGERRAAPTASLRRLAAGLALASLACGGSGVPEPLDACLSFTASSNLNLYDGQAHVVTLYLYPLVGTLGFEQASVTDLLEGASPPGVAGPPVAITVGPGEERAMQEAFPATAIYMGIVADYYRGPGDSEGTRRAIVPAKCGWFAPAVTLSPTDLLVN